MPVAAAELDPGATGAGPLAVAKPAELVDAAGLELETS